MRGLLGFALSASFLVVACGSSGSSGDPTFGIWSFEASSTRVEQGESVTLTWSAASHPDQACTLQRVDSGGTTSSEVACEGSRTVFIDENVSFQLVVLLGDRTSHATSSVQIRVEHGDDGLRMLLDIDDGTVDGNQRVLVGTNTDFTGEDADGDGGIGDGNVDMADFRRFRDWLLQVEDAPNLDLDGSANHPKKDVNGNGQVEGPSEENVYPRADFNGDGQLSRTATSYVPGTVDDALTDLGVLQARFSDPNYASGDLPRLLDSGDVEIWPRYCLDRSDVVRVESSILAGDSVVDARTHASGSSPRHVYTVEVSDELNGYTAQVEAFDADDELVFDTDRFVTVAPGSDTFLDPVCSDTSAPP